MQLSSTNHQGTTILTGANHGLGYETARSLAADRGLTIVLAGRDLADLERAAKRIQAETASQNLLPMHLDLASLDSVRAFANEFRSQGLPPLKGILCNAGISKPTVRERSPDGYEVTFATNHLGHFLLAHLLLESLEPPSRIIFVSSGTHDRQRTDGPMQPPRYVKAEWLANPERDPDLPADDAVAGGQAYASSKLCNVLCAYELGRRLEASDLSTAENPITVNAFNPGLMAGTELGRYGRGMTRFTWYYLMPLFSRFIAAARSTAQSGADLAYLATAPELANATGKYFDGREMLPSSGESYDLELAADLWQTSIELSRLQPHESPLLD
jgi:light-dependent protochlorophyllide reductase